MWQLAGHFLWWILALLLIAGELLVPGYFLLWIGLAAAAAYCQAVARCRVEDASNPFSPWWYRPAAASVC